jgi:hypothetical protein
MNVLRHGDLLLKSDESIVIPKGSISLETNILAEGEKTGHTHKLVGQAQILEHTANDGTIERFVDAQEDSQLTHQEHNTIDIPKGVYRVVQEREFDVVNEMVKEVYD